MKIGKFEGSELLYQDEVHGSLLILADRVIDLILFKIFESGNFILQRNKSRNLSFCS